MSAFLSINFMKHFRIGISCYPTFGGSGVVASMVGLELAQLGHQVHIISYAMPVRLTSHHPNLHFHKVEVTDYPLFEYPPYSLSLATRMMEVACEERLDLFHVHYAIPHAVSAFLAQEMQEDYRIPVVTTLHGTDITLVGNAPSFMPITKFILKKSDAVTAVSQFLKGETLRVFGVERDIDVIPNFVHDDFFKCSEPFESSNNTTKEKLDTLVHISNFRPVKRIGDVLEIFAIVRKHRPAKLLLVGDGPDRAMAERLARDLNIQSDVYFLGKRFNIADILNDADLLIQPSETESFGLTPLEANATCTPVIASDVGGLPEVIINGETGFLLPVGDVKGMAERALELLEDQKFYKKIAVAGRKRAQDHFTSKLVLGMYLDVYNKVL
jgi:N-acetyl-alpha-D-glucosaminyl L-malate synthase BshA